MKSATIVLRYLPPPKFLTMPAVGFEITTEAVRFIELIKSGHELKVGRYGTKLLSDSFGEDEFPSGDALKKIVSEIKNQNKLNFVTVGLPEEKAYLFRTEVPQLSPEEIREGLELKLEEYVPIPPRDTVFDYQIIDSAPGGRLSVSVAVVPNLIVSRYLDFFTSVGLTPVSFQISAQAVAESVIHSADFSPIIIVNVGEQKTGLYLASRRVVHFTSTIAVGGAALTEAIKKYFSVSTEEAQKIKEEQGITGGKENSELFFSLVSTLSVVRDEIEKLIIYWQTHFQKYSDAKQDIKKIILCGHEAALTGWAGYIETSLGIRTELANVWTNAVSFETYLPPISQKDSLSYASAIGLSLSSLS